MLGNSKGPGEMGRVGPRHDKTALGTFATCKHPGEPATSVSTHGMGRVMTKWPVGHSRRANIPMFPPICAAQSEASSYAT